MTALAIVILLVAGACSESPSAKKPYIVGIGDSMLRVASPDLHLVLEKRYADTLIARNGQRIDQMLPALQAALLRDRPVAVVVNLGTNNAIQARKYGQSVADFDRLLNILQPVRCVVVTTVWTELDARFGGTVAHMINARLFALQRQEPRKYRVVDWDALLHRPDGLLNYMALPPHENETGSRWIADQYSRALTTCERGSSTVRR